MAQAIVIPARLASERLPQKVLLDETGWPLIRHVYERCRRVRGVDRVVVAADSEVVARAVREFGGEVILTAPELRTGTDRVAAAVTALGLSDARDRVVNVQGDEPRIDPGHVAELFRLLEESRSASVATLAVHRRDRAGFENPNRVKVVTDRDGFALYFSRAPIPHRRDSGTREPDGLDPDGQNGPAWLYHVGIYGFRGDVLARFSASPQMPLEACEKLEQLRFLELGFRIRVGVVENAAEGIDTPDDYRRFVAHARGEGKGKKE